MFSKITGQSSEAEKAENGGTTTPTRDTGGRSADYDREANHDAARRSDGTTGQQHRLPAGTGPGTSGKPSSESAMEHDRERAREYNTIAGHGTDSAAAHGGGMADTHRDYARLSSGGYVAPLVGVTSREGNAERSLTKVTVNRLLKESHERGHLKFSDPNLMPPDDKKEENTDQLNPVVHETIQPEENVEVQRVKNIERHIHHIQHHIQPVIAKEQLHESYRDDKHPTTTIQEFHGSLPGDDNLFETQMREPKNVTTRLTKEYTTIDKGTIVHENVHHHVHHVIQPVIQQRIIEREIVRSTIPIHEVRHEAPIIHQSEAHSPVTMDHFRDHNGILTNALSVDKVGDMLLRRSPCSRTAEGPETDVEREIKDNDNEFQRNITGATTVTTTSGRRGSRHLESTAAPTQDYGGAGHGHQGRHAGVETDVPATVTLA
ncbi:hypothetical protein AGABI2DRAFT_121583 [Agaricus bisporus var. bisporus H97]|uniref:hypothetical protein n=1 Tax=Agaricus bisporus var. bisporus (strain H97 / ATCC MYA-4626 / FGSC 10389) TaxID=936046 RepID=UPI00029F5726|nr:hypothetical protein AGABI2DRAFT_121583 [Agaricus bisporus var. bisporus H97]EKV43462.1 hypothetical protein AGABI2DRAFT_121583 [Agaricus bisporus var. bisporus H97]